MEHIANTIDRFNTRLGHGIAWFALAMVVVMCASVIQRYLFHSNFIWQTELVRFMHAMLFLTAAGYTLLRDGHVRVDVLYERFSAKTKARVNLAGTFLFLLPVCAALIYFSWDFVTTSWAITERSAEYGGLPGIFILKTFIWIFAVTLILQGISTSLRAIISLKE